MSTKILPVIMCGGAGTRVWPESRETYPKQFIALIGERSTFQETVARVTGPMFDPPIVITNHDYRFLVKEQLDEIGRRRHHRHRAGSARFRAGRGGRGGACRRARAGDDRRRVRRRPCRDQARRFPGSLRQGGQGRRARLYRHARRQADRARDRLRLYPPRRRYRRRRRCASTPSSRSRTARPPSAMSPAAISGIPAISSSAPTTMLEELQAFEPEMARAAAATRRRRQDRPRFPRPRRRRLRRLAEEVDRLCGDGAHQARRCRSGRHRLVGRRQLGRGVETLRPRRRRQFVPRRGRPRHRFEERACALQRAADGARRRATT